MEAFGTLVRRYQDRLYPTVLRLVGSPDDAHDLLQDAFLRAYQKLGSFQGDSSFYTWIYRITVNLALSDRRKRKRMRLRGFGRLRLWDRRQNRSGGSGPIDPADDPRQTDPSLPLEQAERDGLVQAALDGLAPDHRAVVVLKDLDGLRYEEIAATLGVPVGTVRSRLHRARIELRERLRGMLNDAPAPDPATAGARAGRAASLEPPEVDLD